MSLHGSLDTFALPDVLTLLASTGKSGELHVTGERTEGHVWVDGGKVVGAHAGRARVPVDALFELLRLPEGSFAFHADKAADEPGDPADLAGLLAEAQRRLEEWRGIEAVVPSLEASVSLAPELGVSEVIVGKDQWRALVAVAAEQRVAGVVDRLGLGEFDTCRTLKELVEGGLVTIAAEVRAAMTELASEPAVAESPDAADELVSLPARKPRSGASRDSESTGKRRSAKAEPAVEVASEPAGDVAPVASGSEHELDPAEAEALVRQLAHLTGDEEAAARTVEAYEKGELGDGDDDEPINRGLLLKFLSSVRS